MQLCDCFQTAALEFRLQPAQLEVVHKISSVESRVALNGCNCVVAFKLRRWSSGFSLRNWRSFTRFHLLRAELRSMDAIAWLLSNCVAGVQASACAIGGRS